MGIISIEPIKVKKAELNHGDKNQPFYLNLNLHDVNIYGAGKFEVVHMNLDLDKEINITLKVPHFKINGGCKADGKILLLQFNGDGKIDAELGNCQ